MAFIIHILFLALSAICFGQEEDINQQNICQFDLSNDTWFAASMDGFASVFGTDEFPRIAEVGYQNLLIENVPGEIAARYTCTNERRCDIFLLNANCNDNPPVATLLKALANWSNFWFTLVDELRSVSDGVGFNEGREISDVFNPDNIEPGSTAAASGAPLEVMVLQVLYSMCLFLPPVISTAAGTSAPRDFTETIREILSVGAFVAVNPEPTPDGEEYNGYESIDDSVRVLERTTTEAIRQYIDIQLNDKGPFLEENLESNIVLQIVEGDYSTALNQLNPDQENQLTATLTAPAINRIWSSIQVVGLKVNAELFEKGFLGAPADPCDGDSVLPADQKFCDDEGNAFLLRRIPIDLDGLQTENPGNLNEADPYSVPGLNNLEEFSLNLREVVRAAENSQERHGYIGAPTSGVDYIPQLLELDISEPLLRDRIFFNLAICDSTQVEFSQEQLRFCLVEFFPNSDLCILHTLLLCACPDQIVNDQEWPFPTSDAAQCRLESDRPS